MNPVRFSGIVAFQDIATALKVAKEAYLVQQEEGNYDTFFYPDQNKIYTGDHAKLLIAANRALIDPKNPAPYQMDIIA